MRDASRVGAPLALAQRVVLGERLRRADHDGERVAESSGEPVGEPVGRKETNAERVV